MQPTDSSMKRLKMRTTFFFWPVHDTDAPPAPMDLEAGGMAGSDGRR